MAVWECPGCHRRVPDRIAVCHCGTRRDQAAPAGPVAERRAPSAPTPVRPRPAARVRVDADDDDESAAWTVVRTSWPYLVLFVLALTGAAAWGVRWEPATMPPLLGRRTFERPSPSPPPSPLAQPR